MGCWGPREQLTYPGSIFSTRFTTEDFALDCQKESTLDIQIPGEEVFEPQNISWEGF